MTFTIAVAGKGGAGKTTFAGLVVRYLLTRGKKPVLAVDADPNSNLHEVLGVAPTTSVGDICEDMLGTVQSGDSLGMDKETWMQYQIQGVLVESAGFDLLPMGRPEGPGCYCYANSLIRRYVDVLQSNYPYVVMDNEAGMEHLSRRTTRNLDLLVIMTDPSVRGIRTVGRINELADELDLEIKSRAVVVNRVEDAMDERLMGEIEKLGLTVAGTVPADKLITEQDLSGESLVAMGDCPATKAADAILDGLIR